MATAAGPLRGLDLRERIKATDHLGSGLFIVTKSTFAVVERNRGRDLQPSGLWYDF